MSGVGQLQITVTADSNNSLLEYNPDGTPRTVVPATLSGTSTLAAYPDLSTSNVIAPPMALPGQQITISYSLTNTGDGPANGPWIDEISFSSNADGSDPTALGSTQFIGTISAGQSVSRTATVTLPANIIGSVYFVVKADVDYNLLQIDRSEGIGVEQQPTSIPSTLQLTLANPTVLKNSGTAATNATVTRNGNLTQPLAVTISDGNTAVTSAPATITIPANQSSATFTIGTIDDGLVDGNQTVTLAVSANGFSAGSNTLSVQETDRPTLALSVENSTFSETDGGSAAIATVTRNTATTAPLVVSLLSDNVYKVTVPATITIPAGATSVTFPLSAVNDGLIDGPTNVAISAAASGFSLAQQTVTVTDVNVPTLTVSLADNTISESAASPATTGTVTLNRLQSTLVAVTLSSSDTTAAIVPSVVYIPAGSTKVTFPIIAVDDRLVDPNKNVTITAKVTTYSGNVLDQGAGSDSLLVLNSDGPALTVTFPVSAVSAGALTTGTVSRNTSDTSSALVVTLSSSETSHATVPSSVTIPAGAASATFVVDGVDDMKADGLQHAQITAAAAGFATGLATLGVTSVDLPDLVVSNTTAPSSGFDYSQMQVSWTVLNTGQYAADGSWIDQIYLDPKGGGLSSTPVDSIAFNGVVSPGQSYTQTDSLPFPSTVGQYVIRVVTDSNQNVQELSFANNSSVGGTINDQALYHATVNTAVTTVPNGTAIPLSGVATYTSDGAPAPDVPVAIQIRVAGTTRTFTTTTDANGHYSYTFQPLQNEAGEYSVTADDPGVANPTVQAHFEIVGMSSSPPNATVTVVPNTPLTGQFTLTNLSNATLTGLTATASGGPAGLVVSLTVANQISGAGTATLAYSLTDSISQAASGVVTIHVVSAEGAVLNIPMGVYVVPLTPQLAVNPGYLNSGMLVGSQSLVSFVVSNNGGAPSGDLQISLPNTTYLTLVSAATIASLAPGASSTVSVELSPPANLALEKYTGSIGISNDQTGLSVPFTFRAITSAVGDVQVLVDDDYTFQESGSPHVQGATVNLLDPYDNSQVIATGVTDSTGAVTLPNVPAGPYVLQVQAAGHSSYSSSITVVPGISNNQEVFIARQFVTTSWVVQQTTIQDTYQIQLQTTFETDVPAPVVTMSGPSSIPTLLPGQTGTFNLTLTNHGLIAAEGVAVTVPTDPEYTFTALTSVIGVLPAMSSVTVPVTVTRAGTLSSASVGPVINTALLGQATTAITVSPADESGGSCTLTIALTYYYQCGGNDVSHDFFQPINIPLRDCSAEGVSDSVFTTIETIDEDRLKATGPFVVGPDNVTVVCQGIDAPSVIVPSNCNPCLEHIAVNLAQIAWDNTAIGSLISSIATIYNDIQKILTEPTSLATVAELIDLYKELRDLISEEEGLKITEEELLDVINACTPLGGGGWFGSSTPAPSGSAEPADVSQPPAYSADPADMAKMETMYDRFRAITNAEDALFGGNSDWLATNQTATLQQWITAFLGTIGNSSDGGMTITGGEESTLLATTLPDTVTTNDALELIDRWNLSVQYWNEAIFTVAEVPAGQSTDFFSIDTLASAFSAANQAVNQTYADGYSDPVAELHDDVNTFEGNINGQGACATVKLQIDQTAALTRSAFTGTLTITNGMSSDALQDIEVDLSVTDANGNPVAGSFYISAPTFSGGLTAVDGTGTLAALATGTVQYTFIPSDSAAIDGPTLYHIGGTLKYVDPDMGGEVTTPMFPATITVLPQAELKLNYFLQRDVIGDDPFTPQVEPSEPATLGLLVTNVGMGTANNLSISTGQPQIVENQKGLLDTFQIIGTQVGAQQETPSLNVNFGDIAPGQTGDADFELLSSLQGIFTSFTASYSHSDALGGLDTSLISSITTHTLIHAGDFLYSNDTGEIDYLAEDNANPANLPDTIYFSDGTTAPVNTATNTASIAGSTAGSYTVTANVTSGWDYLQLPDPGAGYTLYKVVRSDGVVIPVSDQAWSTDRTFDAAGNSEVDYQLHILDDNSTGSYTVYYRPTTATAPQVTSIQPVSSPQSGPVGSLEVSLNEPIDPSTFTDQALSLTLNGIGNLIDSSVTITQDSSTSFTINGLSDLTAASGNYVFSVDASTISDPFGDSGTGSLSTSWATGTNVPVVVSVGTVNDPTERNTDLDSLQVVLSEPIIPWSFNNNALTLTVNGGTSNLITSAVSITELSDTTYSIAGLSGLTATDGNYVLTVNASNLVDAAGNYGVGSGSAAWTKNTVGPTIVNLQAITQSPRNTIVPTLTVTFSEPIDPSTFTPNDITYSKDGGADLINSSVTITQLSPVEFQIGNFNNLVYPVDGTYTFAVNAADIRDLFGNGGTGSASDTWTLITAIPDVPTNLAISPDTGVSATDGITNSQNVTLTGNVDQAGLLVDIYDGSHELVSDAPINGQLISENLTLAQGSHQLRVDVIDSAANVSSNSLLNVFIDTTAPTATMAPVTSGQLGAPIDQATITFSKPIYGLSLANLQLTSGNGSDLLVPGNLSLSSTDNMNWTLSGLSSLLGPTGTYTLTLSPAGITDAAGNSLAAAVSSTFSIGANTPTVTLASAAQSVNEHGGVFTVTVNLSAASNVATTVPFTLGGTAVNGVNYSALTQSPLIIPAGLTSATITFSAIVGNTYEPDNETLTVTLGTPTNATLGATATDTITITGPPILQLDAPNASYTSTWTNDGPVTIANPLTASVTDTSSAELISLTVTLTSPQLGDVLAADTSGTSISATYNAGAGVLTLSGADTLADYQQVMDSVTYDNSSGGPVVSMEAVSVVASDGHSTSAPAIGTIDINAPPVVLLNGPNAGFASIWTNSGPVSITNPVNASIADGTAADLVSLTVTLTSPHAGDVLAAYTSGTNVSASFNAGAGVLVLSGTDSVANYQQVLASVTYNNTLGGPGVGSETISVVADDGFSSSTPAVGTIYVGVPAHSTVAGIDLFYNQSKFDGNSAGVSTKDDKAIDTTKTAYLPGTGAATFANLSGYADGINGIMVDLTTGGMHGSVTASDFVFKVGANNTPNLWAAAPAPTIVSLRAGAGTAGADRVELIWANDAIKDTWLEVTVLADANTGLTAPYTFFYGSMIGDTGAANSPKLAMVNSSDESAIRDAPGTAKVTNAFDVNKDGFVNSSDENTARANYATLKFIKIVGNTPLAPAAAPDLAVAPAVASDATAAAPASSSGDTGLASGLASLLGNLKSETLPSLRLDLLSSQLTHVNLNTGAAATIFEALAAADTKLTRSILVEVDNVADELGLDDTLLYSILLDLGLE